MRAVDVIALGEALDGDGAAVALDGAAQQVVQDAQAQRAADGIDARDVELRDRRGHDREAARQHRHAFRLQPFEVQPRKPAGADHPLAQAGEPLGRDPALGQSVFLEDRRQRERGARRRVGLAPMLGAELAGDRLDFRTRVRFCRCKRVGAQRAVRKEPLRHADAAELQRLQALGRHPAADDELGRAAADVDDEPRLGRRRQFVRDAEIDEARLFVAADDVDREAECGFGLRQEFRRILRDAERVGRDRAHGGRMQSRQPLAKALEACERRAPRGQRQVAFLVDARAEADRLAPRVEAEDLVAFHTADLEAKAVRAQIDDRERGRSGWRLQRALEGGKHGERWGAGAKRGGAKPSRIRQRGVDRAQIRLRLRRRRR